MPFSLFDISVRHSEESCSSIDSRIEEQYTENGNLCFGTYSWRVILICWQDAGLVLIFIYFISSLHFCIASIFRVTTFSLCSTEFSQIFQGQLWYELPHCLPSFTLQVDMLASLLKSSLVMYLAPGSHVTLAWQVMVVCREFSWTTRVQWWVENNYVTEEE